MSALEQDIPVDVASIEKRLAELWREEMQEREGALTRAALWNVVAHAWTGEQHANATEVLGRASASVPQRTIVVHADPEGAPRIVSWISTNCHVSGTGGRQVCSEEVAIIASGDRVARLAPLVSALLLPDMPVAVWWLGDLPHERPAYVSSLLRPADRLIVDSMFFNDPADFELVARIGDETTTAPADLNWARIEEWRAATAALFDPQSMRARLGRLAHVRLTVGGSGSFGDRSEAILYVAWLGVQTEREVSFEVTHSGETDGIASIEIDFEDGSRASIRTDRERGVVIANSDGIEIAIDCITRSLGRGIEELIVRLLKNPEADRVYMRALRAAADVARRV